MYKPALLLVAHPGHELRLHRFLEVARPLLCVLTDGSGGQGVSRMGFTRDLAGATGARIGPCAGERPDRAWYADILRGDAAPFLAAARAVARAAAAERVALIVADPAEGYNPMHDLCAALAEVVADLVAAAGGARPRVLTYPLTGVPPGEAALRLPLDAAAQARKRAAAEAYAPLAEEARALLAAAPDAAAADEVLLPPDLAMLGTDPPAMPAYERHGRDRLARGTYGTLITQAGHVAPLARALACAVPAAA